jgi:DNA-binding transcriptional MerR regulator
MRIGEIANRVGVNTKTIRFYESIGVLPEPPRTKSGYRDYDDDHVERLRFIKTAQRLSLKLEDIAEILAFRDRATGPATTSSKWCAARSTISTRGYGRCAA